MRRSYVLLFVSLAVAPAMGSACGLDIRGDAAPPITPLEEGGAPPPDGAPPPPGPVQVVDGRLVPPAGWSFATVSEDVAGAGSPCPAGFSSPRRGRVNPRPTAETCTCACGALPNTSTISCTTGTMAIEIDRAIPFEDDDCDNGSETLKTDGSCHPITWEWSILGAYTDRIAGTPPPASNVPCPATATLPPATDDGALTVCTPDPDTALEKANCLQHPGAVPACPTGFDKRRVLADGSTDGRACGACACMTNATCASPTVTFASTSGCTVAQRVVPVRPERINCERVPNADESDSSFYRYSATVVPATACVPAAAAVPVTGALDLVNATTICCK